MIVIDLRVSKPRSAQYYIPHVVGSSVIVINLRVSKPRSAQYYIPHVVGSSVIVMLLAYSEWLLAGWLYDITHDYRVPYIVTGMIEAVGGILLILIPFVERRLHR